MDVKKNFMQAFKELTGNEEETQTNKNATVSAENKNPPEQSKPNNPTEEKPAFSAAFDSIKARYAEPIGQPPISKSVNPTAKPQMTSSIPTPSNAPVINNQNVAAQTPTNPTMNNQPLNQNVNNPANNQPKPSFTPMNNVQKPIVNNPTQNNFNSNKPMYNGNNFDKPISPRPDFKPSTNMDKPLQPKPNFIPKPEAEVPVAENPVTENPVTENPITENPVTEKPIVEKPIVEAQTDQDEFINTFLKARGSDISIEEVKSNDIKTNIEKAFFHPDAKQDMSTAITMITKGTEIIGTVSSTNSIVIGGAIKGDVDSTLNMTITGRVEGNIKCKIADLNDCDIIGDVTVAEHVRITEKTKIDGNIKTNSIEIDGKVKGNIISTASVHIMRNALVIGDIVTSRLSIEEGAMVQGNISMKIN